MYCKGHLHADKVLTGSSLWVLADSTRLVTTLQLQQSLVMPGCNPHCEDFPYFGNTYEPGDASRCNAEAELQYNTASALLRAGAVAR